MIACLVKTEGRVMLPRATNSGTTQEKKRLPLIRAPGVRVYKSTLEVSTNPQLPGSSFKELGLPNVQGKHSHFRLEEWHVTAREGKQLWPPQQTQGQPRDGEEGEEEKFLHCIYY